MGARSLNPLLDVHGSYPPDMRIINPYAYASAGGGFVPTDIAGCKLWLDASQIVGLSDGDPVATWDDESGNGNDATAAGLNRSTYETGAVNGLPVLRFDGSNDNYEITDNGSLELTTDSTLFIVLKTSTGGRGLICKSNDAPSAGAYYLCLDGSIKPSLDRPFVEAGNPATNALPSGWCLAAVHVSGTTVSHYLDGAANGTDTLTTGTATNAPIRIGCLHAGGLSSFFAGDIAEIIIYDSALSTTDRERVEAYLATKYGL